MFQVANWFADFLFGKRAVASTPVKPRPSVAPTPTKPQIHPAARGAAWLVTAIVFVAAFEGFASKPYVDTVGTGHPITWCYGTTSADHPVPPKGTKFTKAECDALLGIDLQKYDKMVRACVHVDLPPHREAALVSFAYNLGPNALCKGPVARYLNANNVTAGCNAILAYDHAGGRRLAGLTRRRVAERTLCLRDD